jgi:hypothetical protein
MATKTKKITPIKLKIRIPHVILDVRGADPKLVEAIAPGLDDADARIRVIGEGAEFLPHAFSLEEALEEGHIWVFLSKKLPTEFNSIIGRGIVPVMYADSHPEAQNYDPVAETGNAFLFPKLTQWHVYGSLVRALENFNFTYDWENLRNHGKEMLEV